MMNLKHLPLQAFDGLPFCVYIKDRKHQYQWGNQFFLNQALGLNNVKDIYGLVDNECPWNNDAEIAILNDIEVLSSNKTVHAKEKVTRYNNISFDLVSYKNPIVDNQNSIMGILGFSMAIPLEQQSLPFTARELDVLNLLVLGYSDKQIAKKLKLSPRTVESHINNMKTKSGAHNRLRLVAIASKYYT